MAFRITTLAIGEENSTTDSIGEEDATTQSIGEEDATTDAIGEEDPATSMYRGEEIDIQEPVYSLNPFGEF
jgi:hypothetical protein